MFIRYLTRTLAIFLCSLPVYPESGETGRLDNAGLPEAQGEFTRGLLALHSFWYEEARDGFLAAQRIDPGFGLAYWGEAMTWDNAFQTDSGYLNEREGAAAVARLRRLDAAGDLRFTKVGRALAETLDRRFAEGVDYDQRREDYAEAMRRLYRENPGNDEIGLLASLATMARPGFDRNRPEHVTSVAATLEQIFERNPAHPGVLHYLLHAYDSPAFAELGLRQAGLYADAAPESSHALHMPSHIYRHLGMWEEVASSNADAWRASVTWQQRTERPLASRDYHALEWLFDALLELEEFERAGEIVDELARIERLMQERGEETGDVPVLLGTLRGYLARAEERQG